MWIVRNHHTISLQLLLQMESLVMFVSSNVIVQKIHRWKYPHNVHQMAVVTDDSLRQKDNECFITCGAQECVSDITFCMLLHIAVCLLPQSDGLQV